MGIAELGNYSLPHTKRFVSIKKCWKMFNMTLRPKQQVKLCCKVWTNTQVFRMNNNNLYPRTSRCSLPNQKVTYSWCVWHTKANIWVNKTCYDFMCQCLPDVSHQSARSLSVTSIRHTHRLHWFSHIVLHQYVTHWNTSSEKHTDDGVVLLLDAFGSSFHFLYNQWTAACCAGSGQGKGGALT